jgi:hypothetical protein
MTTREAEQIRMPFGHYKDSTLGEIAAADVLYLEYMAGQALPDLHLRDAFICLAEAHAPAIASAKARGEKPKLFNASATPGRPAGKQLKLF